MTKGSAKPSKIIATTPLPSLKQARLVGINDHLKSVRQKPATPNPTHSELKQAGLAAFGFGSSTSKKTSDRKYVIETPPSKKRKIPVPDFKEIPETQFTQSLEPVACNPFDNEEDDYSSPLSSPPSEGSSPIAPSSISSFVAMPPPPLPVTPKRRRVLEIPDSKSPPVTPFTPYASQEEKNWLSSQSSPTAYLSKSPITPCLENDDDETSSECRSPTPVPTQILPQNPSTSSLRFFSRPKRPWQDRHNKEDGDGREIAMEMERVVGIEAGFDDRDRVIKSSQWWENEDSQDASLPTQYTQYKQLEDTTTASRSLYMELQEPSTRPVHDEEPFHVDLSYNKAPVLEANGSDLDDSEGLQMGHEENMQESFHSMAYPITLKSHNETPEPEPDAEDDPILPIGEDPESTASEEDPEEINESQEYPAYEAYRTQQFPSSFYQHHTYRYSSPDLPPSSQFIPSIISRTNSATTGGSRDEEPSQFLPGAIDTVVVTMDGNPDQKRSLQPSPEVLGEVSAAATDDSQSPPATINKSDSATRNDSKGNDRHETQGVDIKDEDDSDVEGAKGIRIGTITRSQLLPSELMETFPMPPPLSQFSSYGSYGYEYDDSETQ